jgi:hypothetical protein
MRLFIASLVGGLLLLASLAPIGNAQETTDCSKFGVVRIINTSPDAGGVDVFVNGQKVATNVQSSPVVTPVATGASKIEIRATGSDKVLVSPADLNVPSFGHTTVIVAGQAAGAGQQKLPTLMTQILPDDVTAPAAGQARVRVIQSSPDLGAVDVLVGETKVAANLAYPNASAAIDVPAGRLSIRVVGTGTTTNVVNPIEQDLVAGRTYTIYTTGLKSANTLVTNFVLDRALDAQVRFVHNAAGSPALDVLVDGSPIVTNLSYPNFVPTDQTYVLFPAGGVCLAVAPTGQTTQALATETLNLPSASRWTVVASGLPGAVTLEQYADAVARPPTQQAKCRVINGIPDAGPVDLLADDQKLISSLPYQQASEYLQVPAGTYQIKINKAGTDQTILGPVPFTFGDGQIFTCIMRGTVAQNNVGLTVLTDQAGG